METTKQELIQRYKEKQENKYDRYLEISERAGKESIAKQESSNSMLSCIPMGQPVLVGHHSENAHRNLLKRSWNAMDKSVELASKSQHYADKAEATLNNNSISSDNPEAVDLLKEKLDKLELERTKIKEFNKKARKEKRDSCPAYMLANLSQNISSVKKRIVHLGRLDSIEETEETINGVVLKVNKEDNRVQLFFDGKPEEEVRTKLKRNGFRWSPYNSCWQRQLSAWAIKLSRDLLNELKGGPN